MPGNTWTVPVGSQGPRLTYYGYIGVDCGVSDPINPRANTNYIDEVYPYSNVAGMCVYTATTNIVSRIATFASYGVAAVINVQPLLFGGTPLALLAGASTNWSTFLSTNAGWNLSNIAAIYVVDEPYLNGLSTSDFQAGVNIVKSSLPTIPAMFIESSANVSTMTVPTNIDYFGMDDFYIYGPTSSTWLTNYSTMVSKKSSPQQRIVMSMEGGVPSGDYPPFPYSYFQTTLPAYQSFILSHPEIVMATVYIWPGGVGNAANLGVRDCPQEIINMYSAFGKFMLGR